MIAAMADGRICAAKTTILLQYARMNIFAE